jgi:anti-sigma regulatory factor (Ser/Thr protein kinase)
MDPVAEAAAKARRYVRAALIELGHLELVDNAELGVSELATNATLHGRTPFTIAIVPGQHGPVRIEVTDASPAVPTQKRHGTFATTGRGLRLLEAAGHWGVEVGSTGKTVWFEPAAEMSEAAFTSMWMGESADGLT